MTFELSFFEIGLVMFLSFISGLFFTIGFITLILYWGEENE